MIARGYGDVAQPPEALLAEARAHTRLRPGLTALVALCRARGWPFVVLSHGLTFYIQDLLPPGIPIVAFTGTVRRTQLAGLAAARNVASRQARTSRATSSPTCAANIPDIRPSISATDGSIFPPPRPAMKSSPCAAASWRELCTRARLFDPLDEVVAALEVR